MFKQEDETKEIYTRNKIVITPNNNNIIIVNAQFLILTTLSVLLKSQHI